MRDVSELVTRCLPSKWRLLAEEPEWLEDPAVNVAVDHVLMESVGAGMSPPTLRVWTNRPCVVIGWGEARLPNLAVGAELLGERGFPLLRRYSGGQAVVHGVGYLNFSACMPTQTPFDLVDDYRDLLGRFIEGLQLLGLRAGLGEVPDSYCVGPYDIAIGNLKIAGTAQARRKGAVLVHGTLLVDADGQAMASLLRDFYARAGMPRTIDPRTITSVASELGRAITAGEVAEALMAAWKGVATLVSEPLSAWERRWIPGKTEEIRYPTTK